MSDLKVNSKTQILEFKKKHNLLVEEVELTGKTYETTDIQALTNDFINQLKAGDIVLKKDSTGEHAYIVSFKKDLTGMCLTYTDASCVETISYDYTSSNWVFNSKDITYLNATSGTIVDILGLDSQEKLVKGSASNALSQVDVKVKTIEQSEPNASIEFSAPAITGFTKVGEYCRCIKVNQTFKLILCARYQNDDTENAKSFSLGSSLYITIPSPIGSKIYDLSGKTLNQTPTQGRGDIVIRVAPMGISTYGQNLYVHPVSVEHGNVNQIRISHGNSVSVSASNVVSVTLEVNLTLL